LGALRHQLLLLSKKDVTASALLPITCALPLEAVQVRVLPS
jgi:hypothetical protein